MANPIFEPAISAVLTILLLLLSPAALGISDVPFLVAHKKASLSSAADRVSVSVDIYNQGSATAYDVTVMDDSWSRHAFTVVNGNLSQSWERLDAGGILSHSFELEAKEKGMFFGAPAVITFRIPTKAASQVAYSTPIIPLDVLADRTSEKKFEWAKNLLAKYGSFISVVSIVVLFIHLITTPSKSGAAKGSKRSGKPPCES